MDLKNRADKYIEGLLSDSERIIFENDLKNNLEIREYVQRRKLLDKKLDEYFQGNSKIDRNTKKDIQEYLHHYDTVKSDKEAEFINILDKLSKEKTKTRFISKSFILNLAATIALLVIIGIGLSNKFTQSNNKNKYADLFTQYFQPENDFYFPDMDSATIQSKKYPVSENFNPTQLYNQFNNIVRSGSYNDISLVYISLLLVDKGEEDKALEQLEDIMLNAGPSVSDISRWYYSLLNLKIGKKNTSLNNLHIICSGSSEYSERACSLIKDISEN